MSDEMEKVKISIIMPFYNRIKLLKQAIESVLKQTYKNFELILINDGSTEDVQEVLNIVKEDSRIVYLSQENKGVSAARNLGVAYATGEYIAFLDSDDLFLPDKLEKQLKFMQDKGYYVSHTSYERIDIEGNTIEVVNSGNISGNIFPEILQSCTIATPTVMVKKHVLMERKKPFNANFNIGEDVCLYIDLAYKYEIGGIKEVLTKVRVGEASAAFNITKQRIGFSNIISYILNNDEYSKYEFEIRNLVNTFEQQFSPDINPVNRIPVEKANDEGRRLRQQAEKVRKFKKMNFFPKVSIIIPVYNGTNYMREAIDSALAQTYPNTEILVINDGSTDDGATEKVALSYSDRIRYFWKENGGVGSALNLGIEKMTGDYFSWLSHDDIYAPKKIEKEVLKAFTHKDAIIFCGYSTVSDKGIIIKNYRLPDYITNNIRCLLALDTTYTLNGCALLIPKKLFDLYGAFNPKYRYTQDYDLWFKLSKVAEYVYLDECLVLSRQHKNQDSITKTDLVTPEADWLHYRLISDLSISEIEKYIKQKISMLYGLYNTYLKSGYPMTAIAIMQKIIATLSKMGKNQEVSLWLNKQISIFDAKDIRYNLIDLKESLEKEHDRHNIMIYSNVWTYGGIERVMKIIMDYLSPKYQFILISNFVPNEVGFSLPNSVIHIKLNQTDEKQLAFKLTALAKLLDVKLFIGNPNIMIDVLPVYKFLKGIGIKSIAVNHYYYFLPYRVPWIQPIALQRYSAYSYADVVTWCTSFGANIYAQFHKNVAVMPNPNTFDGICSFSTAKEKIILGVGRFYDSIKRLDRMLIAFQKVYKKCPDAKLLLVGGYDLDMLVPGKENQTIRGLLRYLNMPKDAVIFMGEQTNVDLYYQKASLLLMTSDCEGFGMVLTEAGTFGLPVVMFEIPGVEDIIINGQNGFIVAQDDYESLTNRILSILNDDKLRIQMGKEAKRLSERFSQQKICRRWDLLINTVLESSSSVEIEDKLKKNFMPNYIDSETLIRHAVTEYEDIINKYLKRLLNSLPISTNSSVTVQPTTVYASPCPECINMMNSLSWRITKPLRLAKKFYISLKDIGARATFKKVIKKINQKLH